MMNPTWPKTIDSGQVQASPEDIRKILELAQANQELKVLERATDFIDQRNRELPENVRR
jgi:hypothetical protein